MTVTRYAARIARPLWSSFTARCSSAEQLVNLPYRTISIGRDHLRYGNDDPSLLNGFIGKWVEHQSIVQQRVKGYEEGTYGEEMAPVKTWISFSKSGNTWTCKKGVMDKPDFCEIKFQLGKQKFEMTDGVTRKFLFTQDGSKMIEKTERVGSASSGVTVTRTVNNDIMTARFATAAGEVLKKTFTKQ